VLNWRARKLPFHHVEANIMTFSKLVPIAMIISALFLASCANTMRGMGRDASNTIDATEDAAEDIAN